MFLRRFVKYLLFRIMDPLKRKSPFLSNTGPDPPKYNKYFKRAFNVLCWVTIGPPADCHLNGLSLPGQFWPAFNSI